jgi:hypothetical protein
MGGVLFFLWEQAVSKLIICVALLLFSATALAEDITRQQATGGCTLFIKKILHDPDSSTFDPNNEATVFLKGNRAMVISYVRATNGFGAKRLTEFMCLMELSNGILTPAFVAPKGENSAKGSAIIKKWALFEPAKNTAKKP